MSLARTSGLSTAVEPQVTVGQPLGAVSGVVEAVVVVVVVAAEQQPVGQVGGALVRPGREVVGLGPAARNVAALRPARLVPQQQRLALRGGEDPRSAGGSRSGLLSTTTLRQQAQARRYETRC